MSLSRGSPGLEAAQPDHLLGRQDGPPDPRVTSELVWGVKQRQGPAGCLDCYLLLTQAMCCIRQRNIPPADALVQPEAAHRDVLQGFNRLLMASLRDESLGQTDVNLTARRVHIRTETHRLSIVSLGLRIIRGF